ncbi:unnamed protein product [Euphydryas editha]|uniref:Reverse transcriptase n=1 Tax=Euphydryas editha TaxID=104508 RepID=A0AAU9TFZ1_EUPED|nr:unnamed protein product [Euphydryas editha]
MENTKKMLLIEPSLIERLKQEEKLPEESLSRLDREMSKIMKSKLDDREKWALYLQTLQRYLHICQEKKLPLKIPIINEEDMDKNQENIFKVKTSSIKEEIDKKEEPDLIVPDSKGEHSKQYTLNTLSTEYLLRLIPKTYKRNAEILIQSILQNPEKIKWDDHGLVSIDNNLIPNSNIIDLVNDVLRQLKKPKPVAWQEFAQSLYSIGVPSHCIGNPETQEYLKKFCVENLKDTPNHTPRSNSKTRKISKKIDWERWTPY